jgi:hypothetical protein
LNVKWALRVPDFIVVQHFEVTPFKRGGSVHKISSSRFSEYRQVDRILASFSTQPVITVDSYRAHQATQQLPQREERSIGTNK